jgi:hypothetical protein
MNGMHAVTTTNDNNNVASACECKQRVSNVAAQMNKTTMTQSHFAIEAM